MSLSVVIVGSWLSGVGCQMLTADCWMSLSVVVVGFWLSALGCRVFVVDYLFRLLFTFSIVGAQLWRQLGRYYENP
jgi:hypothetical protein